MAVGKQGSSQVFRMYQRELKASTPSGMDGVQMLQFMSRCGAHVCKRTPYEIRACVSRIDDSVQYDQGIMRTKGSGCDWHSRRHNL